jgi:2-(1,2-epoxy-1,2-dihydrophenyl)acetyl-CoA isomerase
MTTTGMSLEWRDQIAILRMDDPSTLNAVTLGSIEAFGDLLDEVAARARAMILTGAGRAFCSGANIGMGMEGRMDGADYDAGETLDSHINPLMTRLRNLPLPWVSAVNGAAAGVGASLALAGDMIVAGESAFFLQAFSRIGLAPDGGSSHLLVRTIGRARASELMLLGERLSAAKALEWGLINRVVPDAELAEAALALAQRLAKGAYSQRLIRQLAWSAVDADWETTLAQERAAQRTAGQSADHREGVRAFMEKRAATFTGA